MTRDFLGFFAEKKKREFSQVVMVGMPDSEMKLFGLVSRSTFDDLPKGIGGEDTIAVYLPMSYQIGGYTVYLPRTRLRSPPEGQVNGAPPGALLGTGE